MVANPWQRVSAPRPPVYWPHGKNRSHRRRRSRNPRQLHRSSQEARLSGERVRRAAVGERAHLIAVLLEKIGVVGADCGIVFDDGYGFCHAANIPEAGAPKPAATDSPQFIGAAPALRCGRRSLGCLNDEHVTRNQEHAYESRDRFLIRRLRRRRDRNRGRRHRLLPRLADAHPQGVARRRGLVAGGSRDAASPRPRCQALRSAPGSASSWPSAPFPNGTTMLRLACVFSVWIASTAWALDDADADYDFELH